MNKEEIKNIFDNNANLKSEIKDLLIKENPEDVFNAGMESFKTHGNSDRLRTLYYLITRMDNSYHICA